MTGITRHIVVSGRVQGVGYRAWAWGEARALGLRGWVRNLPDGRVEMVASGPEAAVAAMLEACARGPDHARVEKVDATPSSSENLPEFEIRRG